MERHDSLVAAPKKPLKTIADAINSVSADAKTDKFWADLAKPADMSIVKFREAQAAASPEEAAEHRETGLMLLRHLSSQLDSASQAGLFQNEARMCKIILDMLEANAELTMDSPLSHVAAHMHSVQTEGVEARKDNEGSLVGQQARVDAIAAALKPFTFSQTQDNAEMTVTIKVPAATRSSDVRVKVTRETLLVSVAGHALQPHVIDGKLLHAVDASAADWHLEGQGESRELVLDLEKASGGLDWSRGLLVLGK